jgi:hypothetical protein
VEIKPLNNGSAPMSASVDELRATVENLSLSPVAMVSVSICSFVVRGTVSEYNVEFVSRNFSILFTLGECILLRIMTK